MSLNKIIHYVDDKPVEFASYEEYYSFIYKEAFDRWIAEESDDVDKAKEYAELVVWLQKEVGEALNRGAVWMSK